MYFTQEDYRKIENWLQANSVKDTEFPEASSLSLNEQLTIIQRGENKRIKLEDLVNFLFSQSDSELDTSSTKPIQNQAVARAIYELQNRKFIEIVEELPPTSNAKDNVVYILLDEVGEDNNLFTEWIKVNNTWEKVGEFKAEIDLSPYLKIQDSPFEKGEAENSAVLKGGNNQATNVNEVALGKYNISNSDTQFSIGIGASDTDRKNAIEVKVNGDIYIEGVEGRIQDKLNATNILDEQLTELSNKVDTLPQGDEFDKEGNYPLLHVGTADTAIDLAGRGESVPAEFGFRASGGKSIKDGRAYIKRIKGNSVVWNQKVNRLSSDVSNESYPQYMGLTYAYDKASNILTINGTSTKTWQNSVLIANSVAGHTYYLLARKVGGTYTSVGGKELQIQEGYGGVVARPESSSEVIGTLKGFTGVRTSIGVSCGVGDVFDNYQVRVQYIDLTQMFQPGNEPTTIEEFYARKPIVEDEYAYNEGEVIHCNTESIKSVGDNAWDEEWESGRYAPSTGLPNTDEGIRSKNRIKVLPNENYWCSAQNDIFAHFYDAEGNLITNVYSGQYNYLPIKNKQFTTPANAATMTFYVVGTTTYNHDILISLYHSGWKAEKDDQYQPYWQDTLPLPIIRKYFPDGIKKAGAAHDEIRYNKATQKWEYSKSKTGGGKIKSVDLGTLNWKKDWFNEELKWRIYVEVKDKAIGHNNLICGAYFTSNKYDSTMESGSILGHRSNHYIYIKNDSFSSQGVDALIASLQGVILYYEAAEWEWVELDAEDQNFRDYYNVADFGTEQSQSSVPSAAFSADIIYQFNAVDMIREHELEITELQSIIATMQAQLASLTSNS